MQRWCCIVVTVAMKDMAMLANTSTEIVIREIMTPNFTVKVSTLNTAVRLVTMQLLCCCSSQRGGPCRPVR